MRTIKLTHREIEIIKECLHVKYINLLDIVNNNSKILDKDSKDVLINIANEIANVEVSFNGDRDV